MNSNRVIATVISSGCPRYSVGDKIVYAGPAVIKEESDNLCMVAMNAMYPMVYAMSRGGMEAHAPVQCPDCKEAVVFELTREVVE